MKPASLIPLALLLVPSRQAETLAYAPAPGTRLERAFLQERVLEMRDFSVVMNGYEVPSEYLPDLEIDIRSRTELRVSDEIAEVAGGRPLVLLRTYEEVADERSERVAMDGAESSSEEGTGRSELEGRRVRFTWREDDGAYEHVVVTDESASLPEGLEEDLDLRAFLAPGEVEVGEAWEVELEAFAALLRPGGDLAGAGASARA